MTKVEKKNQAVKMEMDPADGIAILTLEMEGRANKINEVFGLSLNEALDWAYGQEGLEGIVITSAHKDFCVGADIEVLFKERDPKKVWERVRNLQALFRRIETAGKPTVAALTGSALGGGFELALACHHRIAVDSPAVQLGLPEVNLGVIPGAGGTQRLPRLVGIQSALEHIAQGKIVRGSKAKSVGFVDDLGKDRAEVIEKAKAWIKANPNAKAPWDQERFKWLPPRPGSDDARGIFMGACAMLLKKTAGAYEAPKAAISAVYEGASLNLDRALEVEAHHFVKLAISDQSKDMMRTIWFHRTAAEKFEGLPVAEEPKISKVAILGAGMMGSGLAFVSANAGYQVVLKDIDQGALDKGMKHITDEVKKMKWLSEADQKAILDRVTPTLDLAAIQGTDLVIEAVVEKIGIKHAVTKETEPLLSDGGVWASNTSALPISDLAQVSKHADRFIGLHFFSPVEKMPLLEVVMGAKTSEETLSRALAYAKKIKKTPIVVNDGYGFYTSRVFSSYIMEAATLVAEGHDPVVVEYAARKAGMVVPPLQVFDEVTLSLVRHAAENAAEYLKDQEKVKGTDLIEAMVDKHGRSGKAAGGGFYDYDNGKRKGLWKGLRDLVKESPKPADTGVDAIADRLMLVQCAEAARLVEKGIIRNKRDAEVGALLGIGFAPNTGGPLSYMDRVGLRETVNRMDELAKKHGKRYAPANLLRNMAEKGETFFPKV